MEELIKRLQRYSHKCLEEKLDYDFALAVDKAVGKLIIQENNLQYLRRTLNNYAKANKNLTERLGDCRNELCHRCGKYKEAHMGACEGCKWA